MRSRRGKSRRAAVPHTEPLDACEGGHMRFALLGGLAAIAIMVLVAVYAHNAARVSRWEAHRDTAVQAWREGRLAEAEQALLAALKQAERFGTDDPRLPQTLNVLAHLY